MGNKVTLWSRLALNLQSFCLNLLSAGIIDVCYLTKLINARKDILILFFNSQDNLFIVGVSDINSRGWTNHENKILNKITVVGSGDLGIACTLAISAKVCRQSGSTSIYAFFQLNTFFFFHFSCMCVCIFWHV